MSDKPISPLRQRMIDDMTARRVKEKAPDSFVVLDLMRMPLGVWPSVRHNVEKPSFGLLRRGLPLECLKPDSRARSLDPVDFCFGFMLRPRGPNRE